MLGPGNQISSKSSAIFHIVPAAQGSVTAQIAITGGTFIAENGHPLFSALERIEKVVEISGGSFPGISPEESAALAFMLNTQKIHDVGTRQRFFQIVADPDSGSCEFTRNQCGRPGKSHVCAELEKSPHIASCNAAVENVTDNRNVQPFQRAFLLAHGEKVEQCLRRMAVRAVTGVDDAAADTRGKKVRCTRRRVAQDNQIRLKRFNVFYRVEESFAFAQTAGFRIDVDDIGAETLFRKLKGDACARAWFDEQVDDGFSAKSGNLFDFALGDFLELLRRIQNECNLLRRKVIETQQIFFCPRIVHEMLSFLFRTVYT